MYHRLGKSLALLILVACFVLLSVINNPSRVSAATNTLGTTSIGVNVDSGDRNSINAFRFTMPNESGTVNSISVYISSPISASPNNQYQVAIYTDQTGPRTLLASSGSQTITGNAWNTVALTASVTANTTYWLTYNSNAASDSADNLILSPIATCDYAWAAQAYGTWPATAPAMASCSNNTASIYATYTISGSAPDTTPPTVSISAPANNATVSTTTSITANASDAGGVAGVQFKLDGANLGAEDTSSPYSFSWDTTTASNATHSLTATARDTSNNLATSSTITVTVSNTGTPPPPPPPTVFISANPSTITAGSSSTLNWSSTNATSCTASGSWSGTQATSGSQSVLPGATSTYTLTCTGTGGSGNQSTTVTVNAVTPPPPPPPPGTFPWSNIISSSRATDWSRAGATIDPRTTICQTIQAYSGSAANINTAINNCPAGQTVLLGPGTFTLNSQITVNKNNVTLRGAGASQTIINSSAAGVAGCGIGENSVVRMCRGAGTNIGSVNPDNTATWTGGYAKGSATVTLSSVSNLAVGSTLWLDQLNDTTDTGDVYMCSGPNATNCANNGDGQLWARSNRGVLEGHVVTAINGLNVTIDPPVIDSHIRSSQSPGAWWGNSGTVLVGAGLEDMTIDATPSGSNILYMINCTNCWVKGVRGLRRDTISSGNIFLIHIINGVDFTLRDNYLYGPIANGLVATYGLTIAIGTNCLIQNNILHENVSPIVPNQPTWGCVFSYNYFDNDQSALNGASIIEHGIASMNLYEGNNGKNFSGDSIHSPHAFETLFRNFFDGGAHNPIGTETQAAIALYSNQRFFNAIGNVLGDTHWNTYQRLYVPGDGQANCTGCIFMLGWQGTGSGTPVTNDANVSRTLLRWGNWDNVTGTNHFTAAEVPSSIPNFANSIPVSQALPASFYLPSQPSWWSTTWGTPAWPAAGPDVSNPNPIANTGGHAYKIPARLCFENVGNDPAFSTSSPRIKLFNAASCYTSVQLPTFTLTVSKNGTGTGTVSGGGISCGGTCSTTVTQGTPVSLTATPDPTSTFNGWAGACSGTGGCSVTANANTSVTATFNTLPLSAPTITTQPVSITVASGATATFSVVASGNPAPTYQWQKNAVNIAGATAASYTTPATSSTDDGSTFRVIVSSSAGSVTSTSATLTVTALSTKFVIGDRIIATLDTAARGTPTISAASLGTHLVGELGTITGGPVSADGGIWWNINWDTGADGWGGFEDRFDKVSTTFDFTMTNGGNKSVVRGSAVTNSVTATLSGGTTTAVAFTASGLPSGAAASFAPTSCNPTCTTTMTITTSGSTPTGTSTITVIGTVGATVHTTTFTLTLIASNTLPVGTFDEIRLSDGVVRGWTYDPDLTSTTIPIQIFFNGPAGTGTLVYSANTDVLRTDINTTFGISGNHGVEFTIPATYRDGASHSVYVYGIDGNDGTKSTLLTGSPKSFTLSGATPPPPPSGIPWTGIIGAQRATDWSGVGVTNGIPARTTICQTLNPGATAAQINTAIGSCPAGQTVFLNAGTYNLTQGIELDTDNVTLRGAGANSTILNVNGQVGVSCHIGEGRAVNMCANGGNIGFDSPDNTATWTGGYAKGSTVVALSSVANLAVGSTLWLDQADDPSDFPGPGDVRVDNWGAGDSYVRAGRGLTEGHIVTAISGNNVTIKPPVIMPTVRSSQNPGAWWGNASSVLEGAGLENLTIDTTAAGTNAIYMINCTNCYIKGVRTLYRNVIGSGQFRINNFINIVNVSIVDNYFYGPQASGLVSIYGISVYIMANSLFQNNIIHASVNPIVINSSSYGNVFAYNTHDNVGVNDQFSQPSLILHGHASMNLLEGNNFRNFSSDNIHTSHFFTTLFRNHFDGTLRNPSSTEAQAGATIYAVQRFVNVVGNVFGSSQWTSYSASTSHCTNCIYELGWQGTNANAVGVTGNDTNVARTILRWGNWDNVTSTNDNGTNDATGTRFVNAEVPSGITNFANPVPANQALPASFYLNSKPNWWPASTPWPPIGPDVANGTLTLSGGHAYKIPARTCFDNAAVDPAYGSSSPRVRVFNAASCYTSVQLPTFTLTVSKNGTGTGTVSGGGISCGGTCSTTVTQGTPVSLTATPDPTSTFNGWAGACSGTGGCSVTVNANTSVTATFNTLPLSAPTITTQPVSITVASGATATFSVVASGNPAPTYQWQKNAVNIAGATAASYTTPATSSTDDGSTFRVIVSSSAGSVTSTSATLTVTALSTKFVIGDRIIATLDTAARGTPTISAASLGTHLVGELGTITGGPVSADGGIWWNINWDTGADGWGGFEDRFDKVSTTFDFTMTNGGNKSVVRGSAVTNTATATLSTGTTAAVTFTASGLPTGTSATFAPTSCNPTCTSTVTLTTTASTPIAAATITITGTSGTLVHTTTFTLTVTAPANVLPVGTFDGIAPDGVTLRGWSYDPDSTSSAVSVQLFINGPAGTGTLISSATTAILRTDINTTFGITGNHGFEVAIPAQYRDGTAHSYYAYGIDFNNSAVSFLLTGSPKSFTVAPPGDTTAPSIPTNLVATATSSTQVNLTWTASTDNVGVTGYKIFRNGTQINTSTTNSYSDTNLTPSTTYSYTVLANDAAGNNSSQSTASSATTPTGGTPVVGDINLDHIVNSIDFSILNSHWFTTDATSDLNHDGIVNAIDFSILNSNWFKTW
jgi:hypothetical protein